MLRLQKSMILLVLFILTTASLRGPDNICVAFQKTPCSGLVIEQVPPAMKNLGFEPEDMILSWKRDASLPANPQIAQGCLNNHFDVWEVTTEQLPRGPVTLSGKRGAQEMSWSLPENFFNGLMYRPNLTGKALVLYEGLKSYAISGNVADGLKKMHEFIDLLIEEKDIRDAAFFLNTTGMIHGGLRNWPQQDAAYAEGVEVAERYGDPRATRDLLLLWGWAQRGRGDRQAAKATYEKALVLSQQLAPESLVMAFNLEALGMIANDQDRWSQVEDYYQRALVLREKIIPGSPLVADTLNSIAIAAWRQGKLEDADRLYGRALQIREKLTPESLAVAGCLNNIGLVAWERGEMTVAEQYLTRALRLEEKLDPGSSGVADTLYNLGALAWRYGDLSKAESRLTQALEIQQKVAPVSAAVASTTSVMGGVKLDRGDLIAAEKYYQMELEIDEKRAPGGGEVASALHNLGALELARHDLDAAESYHRRGLEIKEKLAKDNPAWNGTLSNSLRSMGIVMHRRGDFAAAENYYRRALDIQRQLNMATQRQYLAETLGLLGSLAQSRGDFKQAEDCYGEALKIQDSLSPGSVYSAQSLSSLGDLRLAQHDRSKAAGYYRLAMQIFEKLAPGSSDLAWSRFNVGKMEQEEERMTSARDYFLGALEALESQERKLGGAMETRASYASDSRNMYQQVISFLIQQKQVGEALEVVERSRARMLLNMLAERDLRFAADLPKDLEDERKLTNAEYDRVQSALAELNPVRDTAKVENHLARLRELRDKRERIALQVRQVAPGYASLQYPQPLKVQGIKDALDPGTVLLTYAVGQQTTLLFAVQPGSRQPQVWTLKIGEEALREKVNAFRNVLARRNSSDIRRLQEQGKELYELLVKPAEKVIAAGSRLLLSPDGPLHLLPFAALVRKEASRSEASTVEYLVEWRPLHQVISATIYAGFRARRKEFSKDTTIMAAFGDPQYTGIDAKKPASIVNPDLRSAVRGGFGFAPLPSTRREVEAIAGLYRQNARKYLGQDATEENVKAVGRDVRYLHIACHGLIDERFPLNSALALTLPPDPGQGQDNGLLQAWEIFEHIRLDADLVTMSACETALGKEMGGEGLLGLTQAFQYAGARSVLASLWSVSDDSTAVLMEGFYRHLQTGKPKAEALRLAQAEMIRGKENTKGGAVKDFTHPFHWASFQMIGDWK